jgi:two-component system chemotaxis response regulator CheY
MMPKMSGLEALRLIRREEERHGRIRPHATKVIVTTAADDADSVQGAFHGLCDAYIVKPIVAEELLDVVHCLDPIAS